MHRKYVMARLNHCPRPLFSTAKTGTDSPRRASSPLVFATHFKLERSIQAVVGKHAMDSFDDSLVKPTFHLVE